MPKLLRYTISSLFASIIYTSLSLSVSLDGGLDKSEAGIVFSSGMLGFLSGFLIEYFYQRFQDLSKNLATIRDQVNEANSELSHLGSFLTKLEYFSNVNWDDRLHRWALKTAFSHAWKIPADNPGEAREMFCVHLKNGLRSANKWLGIHEDRVAFFFSPSSHKERAAYIEALKAFKHSKIRIFIRNEDNRDDFDDPETISLYLRAVADHNIESYMIDQ